MRGREREREGGEEVSAKEESRRRRQSSETHQLESKSVAFHPSTRALLLGAESPRDDLRARGAKRLSEALS